MRCGGNYIRRSAQRGENILSGRENQLIHESSPYLIQHAHQPVDWYPWCEEAFARAEREDKPIFLSVGYSTCHWCHVMARESFDNHEIANILNQDYISIKVDREQRPDLDSIYMKVCQAMTGGGGWPMSIFLTPEKKPFFAGTYFPRDSRQGMIGFRQLLDTIAQKWKNNREELMKSAREIVRLLSKQEETAVQSGASQGDTPADIDETLMEKAVWQFFKSYDRKYGGFGNAPKFPSPHNFLFLLRQYEKQGDAFILSMVETTLQHMYCGGLFDHIGYGFCRYATDEAFQIPHFEKMLYDNAMLILAYARACDVTGNSFYQRAAEQTAEYVLREMTHPDGGFYSAQDADSEGEEGRYYVFTPSEIVNLFDEEKGNEFNRCYGITQEGNFEGKSIPHLTGGIRDADAFLDCMPKLREYRKSRSKLGLDDKILASWNGLMLAAMAQLARLTGKECYLQAALHCERFLYSNLWEEGKLHVSCRNGICSGFGYLEDYAFVAFGMLELYQVTQEKSHLEKAKDLCRKALSDFWDEGRGGFYLSGRDNEKLILRTKETYDGAVPSGNAVMAYNLVSLARIEEQEDWESFAGRQLGFLAGQAAQIPMGHAFYLLALSDWFTPPMHVTIVLAEDVDRLGMLQGIPLNADVEVLNHPTMEYPLKNGRHTFYVCTNHTCLPPVNEISEIRF